MVLCAVDSIGLFFDDVEKIRAGVRARWPKGTLSVIVAATHSHQTPDTMGLWGSSRAVSGLDEGYNAYVIQRTVETAVAALGSMKGARLALTRAHPPELDRFIDDDRPPVLHDSEVAILRAARNGKTIGTLVNWANHPEALGSKNTRLTPDFAMALCRDTESRLGGVTVFMNGALGGMQSPLGAKFRDPRTGESPEPNSFRFAEVIGNRVADEVVEALLTTKPAKADRVKYRETMVKIPLANEGFRLAAQANLYKGRKALVAEGTVSAPVGLLRIERKKTALLEAAAIPGELYPELSVGGIQRYPGADLPDSPLEAPIKPMFSAKVKMLFGLANDEIGYIIPKAEWDEKPPYLNNAPKKWYGEVNSVGPEAAPAIAGAVRSLLDQMKGNRR